MVGRLGRKSQFDHLRAHGITVREGRLRLRWAQSPSRTSGDAAFAWSVPSTYGNAVRRNRVRRRLREITRTKQLEGSLPDGWYLVSVLPTPDEPTFVQLQEWVSRSLDRIDAHRGSAQHFPGVPRDVVAGTTPPIEADS